MLIGFTFNNFCSFNIESEFSMEAPTGKVKTRFPDNYTSTNAGYDLLKTAVIVGGVDMVQQALALARKPHVIIATPGRLVDHLENTKVGTVTVG